MYTVESLKAHLSAQPRPGLALDIDDALCILGKRWYDELAALVGHPGLTFEEVVEQYGLFHLVPAWKDKPQVEDWIQATLHSNEHYLSLSPIEKARERVQDILSHIPIHAYITMRSAAVVESTLHWLKQNGFPDLPVLFRPLDTSKDEMHGWKGKAIAALHPEIVGIVDDDVRVIHQLPNYYSGTIFLFGGRTCEREGIRVVPCRDWDEVYEKVKVMGLAES
mgnify:CR=1 FL=1